MSDQSGLSGSNQALEKYRKALRMIKLYTSIAEQALTEMQPNPYTCPMTKAETECPFGTRFNFADTSSESSASSSETSIKSNTPVMKTESVSNFETVVVLGLGAMSSSEPSASQSNSPGSSESLPECSSRKRPRIEKKPSK